MALQKKDNSCAVILSGASDSRSQADVESKDPYALDERLRFRANLFILITCEFQELASRSKQVGILRLRGYSHSRNSQPAQNDKCGRLLYDEVQHLAGNIDLFHDLLSG